MNPIALQTLQLMLSLITSDKEALNPMKEDAKKVIQNLMMPILKDSEELFKEYSKLLLS